MLTDIEKSFIEPPPQLNVNTVFMLYYIFFYIQIPIYVFIMTLNRAASD